MKKWKQKIATVLVLAMLVTLIPVGNVQAKSKSPAKLGEKDFVYTEGGKKKDVIKTSINNETWWDLVYENTDTKSKNNNKLKTKRNVKVGSTASYVKKQYGNTSKVKVNGKDRFYKTIKYNYFQIDISIWKNYLEYNYQKGSDKYKIRFYLDKKNKVTAIVYIKNLDKFQQYPNKEVNPGLIFQTPNEKKVTTKTINGKKVFMIPRGSKIKLKKINGAVSLCMYDVYGNIKRRSWGDYLYGVQVGKSYDFETVINETITDKYEGEKELNFDKLGKYLYFALWFDGEKSYNSKTGQYKYTTAPTVYYFKFK